MDYSIEKKLPFVVNTYSDAKKLLLLIESIFDSLPTIKKKEIQYRFQFKNGEISCTTSQREEFLKVIFGMTDFHLIDMTVFFIDSKSSLNIYVKFFLGFSISSSDQKLLAEAAEIYDAKVNHLQQGDTKKEVLIEHYEHNITNIDQSGQINVNGNVTSSNIATSGFGATTNQSVEKQKSISFWKPILQSLIANWIWWVLGGVVVLVTYFVKLKQG